MNWQRTWRDTVESFLRGLHGDEGAAGAQGASSEEAADPLMEAVAAARAEAAAVASELRSVELRLEYEDAGLADCRRRAEQAERIGDAETVRIARRFEERHERRAALLRRKRDVLADERALCQRELDELVDLLRQADVTGARSAEAPAAPRPDREQRRAAVDAAFRDLEDEMRERDAAARLEELKRRGGG